MITISKKILLIIALAQSIQPLMLAYDATYYSNEVRQILNFAQKIHNTYVDKTIAEWLQDTIDERYGEVSNNTIAKIANIINANHLTTVEKMQLLANLKAHIRSEELSKALPGLFLLFIIYAVMRGPNLAPHIPAVLPNKPAIFPSLPSMTQAYDLGSPLNWLP